MGRPGGFHSICVSLNRDTHQWLDRVDFPSSRESFTGRSPYLSCTPIPDGSGTDLMELLELVIPKHWVRLDLSRDT